MKTKPLGRKAYGSIPHLPGSRLGPGDHSIHEGQERICLERVRDRHDRIIVTEKLDGSNVCVARVDDKILSLGRAGYAASTSPYEQHQLFADWVNGRYGLFDRMLRNGESLHGEWLAQAHGTLYEIDDYNVFVAFDLKREGKRVPWDEFAQRVVECRTPHVLLDGPCVSVDDAMDALGVYGYHGAKEQVEGAVWRVERSGEFDFMAKYVRPDKVDGKYLASVSGADEIWNWRP